jgi:hypothetical protein
MYTSDLQKCVFHSDSQIVCVRVLVRASARARVCVCVQSPAPIFSFAWILCFLDLSPELYLSAKLVPTFADRGLSRGQSNGSLRPLISVS